MQEYADIKDEAILENKTFILAPSTGQGVKLQL